MKINAGKIMTSNHVKNYENHFIVRSESMRWLLVVILFVTAFGIRVVGVTQIPMNYHPVKQYRAALTARAFYYSRLDNAPVWETEVAQASLESIGFLGPPLVDSIAAAFYLISGTEALWIPKLLSSIYWMIGGFFLYASARRMMNEDAALLSTSIYLLLPFGVVSSQSFQPDPLMLMFMIISIYMIIVHYEHPTRAGLIGMGIISAIAILIKPVSLFIIFGAYLALQYHSRGLNRNLIFNKDTILFVSIALLPSLLYYGYGILNTANLDQQAQKSFIPQLFLQFNFWDGWLKRIRIAVGYTLFLGGMLGAFLYPDGWRKKLLFGLWIGYFTMCFAFTYTISTHDYYHLPLFPVIALSFGSIAEILTQNLRQQATNRYLQLGMAAILFLAFFLGAGTSVQALGKLPDYQPEIILAQDVGEAVSHSTRTIFLAPHDGKPLMYHAKIAGQYWPYWFDIRDEKLWGITNLLPDERLQMLGEGMNPEYFIVTDLAEFENQADLTQYLNENYPVVIEDSRFVIFDLAAGR
jgi:hypothetical protein